jgi:hypothetical protein
MIDVEESLVEMDDCVASAVSEGSAMSEGSSTDSNAADSEWTAFSEEAEGIEMYF